MATDNPAPNHYSTVCPYLNVDNIEKQMEFLHQVFDAEVKETLKNEEGMVLHGEVVMGNVVIMLGKGSAGLPVQPSMNYVYVSDADLVFKKAMDQGAISLYPPDDKFYGLREAGFRDMHDNTWFIAQYLRAVSAEEMEQGLAGKK